MNDNTLSILVQKCKEEAEGTHLPMAHNDALIKTARFAALYQVLILSVGEKRALNLLNDREIL